MNTSAKRIIIFSALIIAVFLLGSLYQKIIFLEQDTGKPDTIETQTVKLEPTPTSLPTPTSITTPTSTNIANITPTPSRKPTLVPSPYEILSKIGKEVAGNNSSVSIFKNDDGSIDVINNIQFQPEITWGLDAETRKMVTDFLTKSYTSDLNIRYVLVTVSYLHTGIPATRVGVGINQVSKHTKEEWKEVTPYDLCNWLKGMQIGDDVDPIDPYFDPSSWAFAKNYKCS